VAEQKTRIQGIGMSRGVELVLVIKQEVVVLLKAEPLVAKGIPMAIKVKYSEPKLNQ
jgi:hypothetical protein